MSIRVFLADDQALVLSAFALVVRTAQDMDVVGTALDGADLLRRVAASRADVVLMDLRMPEVDGITATAAITARHPEVRVLVLTTFDGEDDVIAAVRAGASGYLLKEAEPEALLEAIRRVHVGDAVLAPSATRRLLDRVRPALPPPRPVPPAGCSELTGREQEVLRQLARGLSNAEVGDVLFLSETTVKSHVGQILTKLEVRDRLQAVVLAYRLGLVSPDDPPRGGGSGHGTASEDEADQPVVKDHRRMPDAVVDVPAAFVLVPVGLLLLLAGLGRVPRSRRRVAWVVAATLYAVAVVDLTFFPMTLRLGDTGNKAAWSTQLSVIPFATFSARTFVLNILLFVPLGALLVFSPAPVSLRTAGVMSLACSGLIEAIQLGLNIAASAGRSADVDDLLANSLGGAVGFLCVRALVVIALPRQGRTSRRPAQELCSEPA